MSEPYCEDHLFQPDGVCFVCQARRVDPLAAEANMAREAVRRTEAGMVFGFNRHLSPEIVPIVECPILRPEIVAAFPMLRVLAERVCATAAPFHLSVTLTASGLDVAAMGGGRLSDERRRAAADFAIREGLARLSVDGGEIVERGTHQELIERHGEYARIYERQLLEAELESL